MHDNHLSRRTLFAATAATVAVAATASTAVAAPTAADNSKRDRKLKKLIAGMSVEQKVGQLFVPWVVGSHATELTPDQIAVNRRNLGVDTPAEAVRRYHLGGIIYFRWSANIVNPRQLATFSNGIQTAAVSQNGVPVLISVDQEHGGTTRIGRPATQLPGAMALGAGYSVSAARTAGKVAGTELAAMGILQNFAPVADVNVNPANPIINVRSFGSDPQAAARMVAAQVQGYQGAGVATSAKHFPGHGDTGQDSHTHLPVITHTREEWERIDAPPFKAAIAAGVDSIMTAHLQVPALDPSNDPATLSHPIITGVLREELGYDGVIVTDALNMEGVRIKYGDARIPVLAIKAGCDQLLFPFDFPLAYNSVVAAVKGGELTEARIEESVLRILRLKEKLGLLKNPFVSVADVDRKVGNRRHLRTADRIAEDTATLIVNEGDLLPLNRRKQRKLLVVGANPQFPTQDGNTIPALTAALTEQDFEVTSVVAAPQEAPTSTADRAVAAAAGKDAVVVTTQNVTGSSAAQRALVQRLVATGVPVVHVAVQNPYDIAQLPGVKASLATYCWTDTEMRATARIIAGRAEPGGRLPVTVQRADNPAQELYPLGHGLKFD
ncbi:glycoside hydrolase family 3 protein [Streptomyces sp. CAU 1734]|uniref:glycoside hydrolase family 3 protein n=1 Tax=Streptomyces sp. CAU 1734 TaxID=3140360 RepID=UPI003261C00C